MADSDYPVSNVEQWVIISICLVVFVLDAAAYAYAYYHRSYPPLKAKHVPVMGAFLFGAFCWWLGMMHANGVFRYNGVWSVCALWSVWMQVCFGVMLMLAVYLFRLYTTLHLFVLQRPLSERPVVVPVLLYAIPAVAFGLVGTFVPPVQPMVDEEGVCTVSLTFKVASFIWVGLALLGLLVLSWKLRNVRSAFNEYRELRAGCIALLLCLAMNSTLVMTRQHVVAWGIYTIIVGNMLTTNFFFWLILAQPLYGHLFRREACMNEFLASLTSDSDGSHEMTQSLAKAAALEQGTLRSTPFRRF